VEEISEGLRLLSAAAEARLRAEEVPAALARRAAWHWLRTGGSLAALLAALLSIA
jgi:hypothetical protein